MWPLRHVRAPRSIAQVAASLVRQATPPDTKACRLHEALDLALPPWILHLDTDNQTQR